MADTFANFGDSPSAPARNAFAIAPHATNEISPIPKAIRVGTGGDITLRTVDGLADVVIKNVANGETLDLRVKHIRVTGTTAADIVGLS